MADENTAEAQATAQGIKLATPDDFLKDYGTHTFTTESGKGYTVESFVPGNLLIEVGSPVVRQFTDGLEEGEESVRSPTSDRNVYEYIKQLVCDHVISLKIVNFPQHQCGPKMVSINRLPHDEILEIYRELRDFSMRDADTFPETSDATENGPPSENESD